MIGVFVGFSRIFVLGILIFKGLTARRLYKTSGVKGLNWLYVEVAFTAVQCCTSLDHMHNREATSNMNLRSPLEIYWVDKREQKQS
jgi:hypothetical protein